MSKKIGLKSVIHRGPDSMVSASVSGSNRVTKVVADHGSEFSG
jgi:hypothetical protein